jgi:16S rRNA (guanine1207-N2)-methyltransferase
VIATAFDFSSLRRYPDVEAPNLHAVDATDRLILDEAADALASHPHEVLVIDDHFGALTLGAIALHGARGVRVYQDSVVAERALAANAGDLGAEYHSVPLDEVGQARVVLWQLPRSLDLLEDIAGRIASQLHPDATVYAGGRIKHMTTRMNEALAVHFGEVRASLARQKSRVLVARDPQPGLAGGVVRDIHSENGIRFETAPGVFAGGRLDIGTRALLAVLDQVSADARTAVDLGCGSGILAATLAAARPGLTVTATDVSHAAVDAARVTAELNGLTNVVVLRDDAGSSIPDDSVDVVLLNPPFHAGSTVHTGIASKLFAAAARMLRSGGELWTVYNSSLGYRSELARVVGPTREVSRTRKFTVTASRNR